jgi:hypothetical protein
MKCPNFGIIREMAKRKGYFTALSIMETLINRVYLTHTQTTISISPLHADLLEDKWLCLKKITKYYMSFTNYDISPQPSYKYHSTEWK